MQLLKDKWRVDPHGNGLWRVISIGQEQGIIVKCGHKKELAEHIVEVHNRAIDETI